MKKRGDSLHLDMPIAEMLAIVAQRGEQACAGCGGDDAGSAAAQRNRGTNSRGRRIVADDRRRRHRRGDRAVVADRERQVYMGIGGAPRSSARRGGDQMPKQELAMQNVATRRKRGLIRRTSFGEIVDRVYAADKSCKWAETSFSARPRSVTARLLPGLRAQAASRPSPTRSSCERSKTVRFVRARHDLQIKTIRLRWGDRER